MDFTQYDISFGLGIVSMLLVSAKYIPSHASRVQHV
jgi:hypothetical protein